MRFKQFEQDFQLLQSVIKAQREAEDDDQKEAYEYLCQSFWRIMYTFLRIPKIQGVSILEIGAFPYLMTALCFKYITNLQYFGISTHSGPWEPFIRPPELTTKMLHTHSDAYTFKVWLQNVEKHEFPFEDNSFDTVLCTEVIEHLLFDASFMIKQIVRVLKPGGTLILSTGPNVLHWSKVLRLVFNVNIYDPYREGGYGRHNRLYTPGEIQAIISKNGLVLKDLRVTTFDEVKYRSFAKHLAKRSIYFMDKFFSTIFSRLPFFYYKFGLDILLVAQKPKS